MKIDVSKLKQPLELAITGQEPWLSEIYKPFANIPSPQQSPPLLTATLTITLQEPTEYVRVVGQLQYTPWVDCSRCADPISWPVTSAIDEYFCRGTDPNAEAPLVDRELAQMEDNFLPDDMLDIAALLNETVQLALPTQLVKTTEDGRSCVVCQADVTQACIHKESTADEEAPSPFAALKDLKLKH
mgnify:CR=1 FL=1